MGGNLAPYDDIWGLMGHMGSHIRITLHKPGETHTKAPYNHAFFKSEPLG